MSGKATVHKLDAREFDDSIQKGIPIPPKRNGPVSKYRGRMERLEIGDSFFIVGGTRHAASGVAKQLGITIETRAIGNGMRIWRTK